MDRVLALTSAMTTGMEVAGVLIIGASAPASLAVAVRQALQTSKWGAAYDAFRASFGRGILLGLEFLVAADIIRTVAVTPSLESVAVLSLIVLIRTFLSFSLKVEIEGDWPWRRSSPGTEATSDEDEPTCPAHATDADQEPSSAKRSRAGTSNRRR